MKLQDKLNEFKKALRDAIINQAIPITISPERTLGYTGEISVNIEECELGFCVAKTFVCYYNPLIKGTFSQEDIDKLNEIIENKLSKDKDKVDKIRELESEAMKLRKELQEV